MFKKAIIASALVASSFANAQNKTLSIHTGGPTGAYYKDLGPAIKSAVEAAFRSMLKKTPVFVTESAGSNANIDAVLGVPGDLALAQKDVIAMRTDSSNLLVVREDIASECLYMVVGAEFANQVDSFGQILAVADGLSIATGSDKSGAHATLSFLKSQVPELSTISISNYDSAAKAIEAVANGEEAVAFFVQMPDPSNANFKLINDNKLGIVGVGHENMFNLTVQDLPVYEVIDTTVQDASWGAFFGRGNKAKIVSTACTPAALITNKATDSKLVAKLKAAPVDSLRPQVDWFQKMLNTSTKAANPSALLNSVKAGINKGIEGMR